MPDAAFQFAEPSLVSVPASRSMETIFAAAPPVVAEPEVPSLTDPSRTIPTSNHTMSFGFTRVIVLEAMPDATCARAPPPLPNRPLHVARSAVFRRPRITASMAEITDPELLAAALTSSVSIEPMA
jgi:hypothetical protein